MAITWGTEVKNSTGNGMRLGYEFSQSPSSVGASTSSVTVTLKVYVWTRASVFDSSNSFAVSGNFSTSGNVNISHSGSDTTLVATLSRSVSTSYSSTVKSSFSASLSGIAPISGTARVSGTWTTGKRPIGAPDEPTSVNVSRVSDTKQTVTWTRVNPTAASKPYQSQELRRWDRASDTYKTIANLSASATSYSDTSTRISSQYRYAIRAKNSAGSSALVYSDYISTKPYSPNTVKATKSGGDIRVTWTNPTSPRITAIEVWLVQDGVLAGSVHVQLSGSPTSWTHVSPDPGSTWAYRLKTQSGADSNDAAPNLYSDFSTQSNTVQLLTNPAPPTNLKPSSLAFDATDDLTFTWQHNDIDSTAQTAYQVEYRVLGTSTWTLTGKINSSVSSHTVPADTFTNGETMEWRVQTWGEYAVDPAYSPWSATAILTLSSRPAATILSPVGLWTSSRVTVAWEFFDSESASQIAYRIRLEDSDNAIVFERSATGSTTSYDVPTPVGDGGQYTVYLSVRDGDGVWSLETSEVFTVDYADPPAPTIQPIWDVELGAVTILIEHPAPAPGEVEVDHAQVWRSGNGEDWVLIADNVPPSTSLTDFIPALDAVNYYRVTSVSAMPSSTDSVAVAVTTPSEGWSYINGDPSVSGSFSSVMRLRYNPAVDVQTSRQRVLHHFAGRSRPVEFSGEAVDVEIQIASALMDETATREDAEAFALFPAPLCYRDPDKRRVFVSIDSASIAYAPKWHALSLSMKQVDHIE